MLIKRFSVLFCLFFSITLFAQNNFSYTPQHPKPGDLITITYEPAGAIAGTMKPVEATYYMLGPTEKGYKNIASDDLKLNRQGKKFTTTLQTDTASHFIYLGFASDKKFDNNFNEGYYIVLAQGNKPRKGAYNALSLYYQFLGRSVGLDANNDKALEALEKEINLYPETKPNYIINYARLLNAVKKAEAPALVQKEIESLLKAGLKTEEDYQVLESLYGSLKLPEQAKMIAAVKKEKYPQGKWQVNEQVQKFLMEQDPKKSAAMAEEMIGKIKTDPAWKDLEPNIEFIRQQPLNLYRNKQDYEGFQMALATAPFKSDADKASFFNNMAWDMQKTSTNLAFAEEMSRFATEWAKKEMTQPSEKKPAYITTRQWQDQRKFTYAMYADTYGMIMYRMGQYKKGLPYAKEAALVIHEGKDPNDNNTYTLLAEKVLPQKQFKKEVEEFIKNGKSTPDITEALKRVYIKEKGSDGGFEEYIAALEKEQYLKMMEELRKSMLNEAAPSFALLDMNGKNVSIADLKGKVVVVDFWATWCGPCKASFPGMQKMVSKFKDDPNVKFVFIDTWERNDDKTKNASDFITSNKYNFHVLMDDDNKVVELFKVEGIPTKFVIDKNGIIRFKSVGFDGSDDKLVSELTAMINLAAQPEGGAKTF